jgi:hypothetical protein
LEKLSRMIIISIYQNLRECLLFKGSWKMCEYKMKTAKGARHRAQGKTGAKTDVSDDPFRGPFALRLAP